MSMARGSGAWRSGRVRLGAAGKEGKVVQMESHGLNRRCEDSGRGERTHRRAWRAWRSWRSWRAWRAWRAHSCLSLWTVLASF